MTYNVFGGTLNLLSPITEHVRATVEGLSYWTVNLHRLWPLWRFGASGVVYKCHDLLTSILIWVFLVYSKAVFTVICGHVKAAKVRWRARGRRRRRRGRRDACATTGDDDDDATVCDANKDGRSHPARLLTDLNNPSNRTCWISAPMAPTENSTVNLTVNFGKKYEV